MSIENLLQIIHFRITEVYPNTWGSEQGQRSPGHIKLILKFDAGGC